jgi:hypothetical protein
MMYLVPSILVIVLSGLAAASYISPTNYVAVAQNSDATKLVNVLLEDAIQAINSNDTSQALTRLNLASAQIQAASNNSISLQTSQLFIEDALKALKTNDSSSAIFRIGLAQQGLTTAISNNSSTAQK